MSVRTLGQLAFWLLFALEIAWHGWLAPPETLPRLIPLLLFAAPLALPAIAFLRGRPSALFWAGVLALLPFCHGVSELWTDPSVRWLAALEIALVLLLYAAIAVDGVRRKRARRA